LREREIFEMLAQGRNRPFIEKELVLSSSIVKTHVSHIYQKTGVHSRQELIDLFMSCSLKED
jgi:DNA-binding NarL/FixJ family response regulator